MLNNNSKGHAQLIVTGNIIVEAQTISLHAKDKNQGGGVGEKSVQNILLDIEHILKGLVQLGYQGFGSDTPR